MGFRVHCLGFGIQGAGFVGSRGGQVFFSKTQTLRPATRNPQPQNPKPQTQNPKTLSPKPQTLNRGCIELPKGCMLKDRDGDTMRSHKGRYKVARAGWYNIRVRRSHGPDARWDELDAAVKDEGEGLGGKEEVHEEDLGDDFDKYLQEQAKAEADRKFEEEVAAEVALEKAEKGSNSSGGSWEEEDPFAAVTAIDRTGRSQVPLIDPRSIPEDRETLTNILSGGEGSLRIDSGDGGRETVFAHSDWMRLC